MFELIETIPVRVTTKNGLELDAVEHARELSWRGGERKAVKRGMNRRYRRQARQVIRTALSY
jgi:hypothetical protein